MRIIAKIGFILLQLTWCLPQNLIGAFVFLLHARSRHELFHNSVMTTLDRHGPSVSMGAFIFVSTCGGDPEWMTHVRCHEYGHTIQSLMLGPLYLLVIGLPSSIWCNFFEGYRRRHNIPYSRLFCESWANRLGAIYTHTAHRDMDRPE